MREGPPLISGRKPDSPRKDCKSGYGRVIASPVMRASALLAVLLGFAAAAVAQPTPSVDDVAKRAIDVMAGPAWEKARYIAFTFNVERDGKLAASFPQRWDRYTGNYRVSGQTREGVPFEVVMNVNSRSGHGSQNGTAVTDPAELAKFGALAHRWWDPTGDFKPLHDINPLRLDYIARRSRGLEGKQALDVGCGGGILAEAMATAGAKVLGIDLSDKALAVARLHQLESGVEVDYQLSTAETLAAEQPGRFEIVTCMELLEHVPDPASTIAACATLVKPGGLVVFSTINRNPKAYLFAVIGGEYLLRLLPRGTHDYARFIKPSELVGFARRAGLEADDLVGMTYNPLTRTYRLQALKDAFLDYYAAAIAVHTRLFAGAEEVLAEIERRRLAWGIVTNKAARFTLPLLEQLALASRANVVVCGDTTAQAKPHPAPLLHAVTQLGLDAAGCVYVGDAERDVAAARAAGMASLVARYGYIASDVLPESWKADGFIDSLPAVLDWLPTRDVSAL